MDNLSIPINVKKKLAEETNSAVSMIIYARITFVLLVIYLVHFAYTHSFSNLRLTDYLHLVIVITIVIFIPFAIRKVNKDWPRNDEIRNLALAKHDIGIKFSVDGIKLNILLLEQEIREKMLDSGSGLLSIDWSEIEEIELQERFKAANGFYDEGYLVFILKKPRFSVYTQIAIEREYTKRHEKKILQYLKENFSGQIKTKK